MTHYDYLKVPGMHLHPRERMLLKSLAETVEQRFGKYTTIVNIGIATKYGCASIRCLAAGTSTAKIYGIDIEESYVPADLPRDRIEFMLGSSPMIGKNVWEGQVHLLFVDGDHTREGVTRDIDAWGRFVPFGGFMAFHDYDHRGPGFEHVAGVHQAVNQWMRDLESDKHAGWARVGVVNSICYFERQYPTPSTSVGGIVASDSQTS